MGGKKRGGGKVGGVEGGRGGGDKKEGCYEHFWTV